MDKIITNKIYYQEISDAIAKKKNKPVYLFPSQMALEIKQIKTEQDMLNGDLKEYNSFYIPATGRPVDADRLGNLIHSFQPNNINVIISDLPAPTDISNSEQNILNGTSASDATVFFKKENDLITIYSKNGGGVFAPYKKNYANHGDFGIFCHAFNLNLFNFNTSKTTDMSYMFANSKAVSLDLSNFDTSEVTNMNNMFLQSATTSLDLSNFNTNKVTDMSRMFYESKATTLDLSSFDTSNVTNMFAMFANSKTTSLDLSSFDTSNVINMSMMFGSSQMTSIDLSSFDTSKVTDMSGMFGFSKANILDLSNFDTSKVTDMSGMFWGSSATSINLSNFNTSNVTDMSNMFANSKAASLDLSNFDTSKVTNMNNMFVSAATTTIYCRTEADKQRFLATNPPSGIEFIVKGGN